MSKLLIVDDEIDIREFARNYFKKRGIQVFTASGGSEALDILKEERPDLILLDVRMEEMTGVEFLQKMRGEGDPTKVIMVSGIEDEETINQARSLGIIGFIHKPLVLEELQKIVMKELKQGA
ncbi:MAG TPA: response regulator [Candidatus Omnitrophota bacterium]|nr:response regulator [Candidatus Omnitrophota bacterium]HSA31425.1 response regulator [Candidatus Omnitrophota bacterium]